MSIAERVRSPSGVVVRPSSAGSPSHASGPLPPAPSPASRERGDYAVARLAASWDRVGLAGVLLLAAGLDVVGLGREAYGNTYYAAAVKSMLTGWRNFFFVSFDSGGFVAVDKPPLGLWVQAASAWLFGFNGLSLLMPQAIAGVLSVALLYYLVRRAFGTAAGLFAALALAVTPISVVTNRNNTMDSQLVLVLLLAVWAASLAAERGRLKWLLACAVLLGLGYNVKMLQAFLVLPACWLAYALCAPIRVWRRLARLALATVVLLGVSLSWSIAVDLTPADARPFVGSSGSNSAISLALGYNGLGRITQALAEHIPLPWLGGVTVDLTSAPGFAPGIGNPSVARLFTSTLADQASWLLPLAILGLVLAGFQAAKSGPPRPTGGPLDPHGPRAPSPACGRGGDGRRVALVLWGGWLLACLGYFSFARFYHIYYLVMLGPAVAALAGIGIVAGWQAYRQGKLAGLLLPPGLVATAAMQALILAAYPTWSARLTPGVVGLAVAAAIVLVVRRRAADARVAALAVAVGGLALLVAPTAWSVISVENNNGAAWLPQAGPSSFGGPGGRGGGFPGGGPQPPGGLLPRFGAGGPGSAGPRGGRPGPGGPGGPGGGAPMALTFAGDQWDSLDPGLVRYLLANQGEARFLVATPTSSYASLFILAGDQPAMALGGYQGWDRILTPAELADIVRDGTVRYFYLNGVGGFGGGRGPFGSSLDATADLAAWVRSSCAAVPPEAWQAGSTNATGRPAAQGQQLYDCGTLRDEVTP